MGREVNRLSAREVKTIDTAGRHADGGGLYLIVDPSGARRWVMLYRFGGKRREMGFGPAQTVALAKAREMAAAARLSVKEGRDPLAERKLALVPVKRLATFGEVAETFLTDNAAMWRNPKHRAQWRSTLVTDAASLWNMPVAEIGTDDVLAALRPIWQSKPETARRVRGRIERILAAAGARKLREGVNPATWRGHLDALLPRAKKLTRGHHAALPYAALPAFYAGLCEREAVSALALRFIILTAARSGEVRAMTWAEVNLDAAVWTVPAGRMKAGRMHRVPLSAAARDLLLALEPAQREDNLVFPSPQAQAVLSDMVFAMLLRRGGQLDITTHGFRSTFRDWVDAETEFPGDLAEAALAHLVGDETERAYRRGDALVKRRALMDAWAHFVLSMAGSDFQKASIES